MVGILVNGFAWQCRCNAVAASPSSSPLLSLSRHITARLIAAKKDGGGPHLNAVYPSRHYPFFSNKDKQYRWRRWKTETWRRVCGRGSDTSMCKLRTSTGTPRRGPIAGAGHAPSLTACSHALGYRAPRLPCRVWPRAHMPLVTMQGLTAWLAK